MYTENGESFLQLQFMLQETSKQSNNDWHAYDATEESESNWSKCVICFLKHYALDIVSFARIRRRFERFRRAAAAKLCCPNCKIFLIGLLIGALVAGIALAPVLTMYIKSNSGKCFSIL